MLMAKGRMCYQKLLTHLIRITCGVSILYQMFCGEFQREELVLVDLTRVSYDLALDLEYQVEP